MRLVRLGLTTRYVPDDQVLVGRSRPAYKLPTRHLVNGRRLREPYPMGMSVMQFGMGCFWGAEHCFWSIPGVYVTSVGYGGGSTPWPTYEEVCGGYTNHAELTQVVYDPKRISCAQLVKVFLENHDPTAYMYQGNDVGTQYRSCIFAGAAERRVIAQSLSVFRKLLRKAGYGVVHTIVDKLQTYYLAEETHQQYLAQNPHGYCPDIRTGVTMVAVDD